MREYKANIDCNEDAIVCGDIQPDATRRLKETMFPLCRAMAAAGLVDSPLKRSQLSMTLPFVHTDARHSVSDSDYGEKDFVPSPIVRLTERQHAAFGAILESPARWLSSVHGHTQNFMMSGWVIIDARGRPTITKAGIAVAKAAGAHLFSSPVSESHRV